MGMLVVAERINASRKNIRAALERLDSESIQREALAQAKAGANYIDINGGTFPGREAELLTWLVEIVQEATELPLCLDSSDPAALAAALPKVKTPRPMINSITLEDGRFEPVLRLVIEHRAKVIALCQGQGKPPVTISEKENVAVRMVGRLTQAGVPLDDIYVDPLVFPLATDPNSGQATIGAIRAIMKRFPGIHTICGLTNISHGIPARKLVNRTFLACAMAKGLDSAILDPTDSLLMSNVIAAEAALGIDEYCINLIGAFQSDKLG